MANNVKDPDLVDAEKISLVNDSSKTLPSVLSAGGGSEKQTIPHEGNGTALNNVVNKKQGRGSPVKQILAALAAQLGTVNTGMVFGFSAIALPQMKQEDSFIHVTSTEESWIASINAIGTPIGCFFSGYLADLLGRKRTLILTEVPTILGWLLIAFATNIEMVYAGRFFVGLGSGMVGAPARVYAAEVTQPHLRGMLVAFASVGVSTGVFIEYVLGGFLPWTVCAGISSLVPITSLILIFMFPETPSYLMSQQKPEQARRALNRLRGGSCDLEREMDTLVKFSNKNQVKHLNGPREILTAVLKPSALKPLFMLILYFLIYQWSGTNAITFYATEIFIDTGVKMNKEFLTGLLGFVRLLATVAACILCRRCGRRPLTFVSAIGCGLSMLGIGLYKLFTSGTKLEDLSGSHSWIPAFCVFTYTIACTLGFLVIPWVMIGEVYPLQVRGIVGGLTTMSAHLFVFSVVKTYPLLRDTMTDAGVYIMYGVIPLVGTIYFYMYLIETKGKSLQEIEDYYSGRSSNLNNGKTASEPLQPSVDAKNGKIVP